MAIENKNSNTLEENRIVYMSGAFTEEKAKEIVTKLIEMDAKDPTKSILMIIDSYGGYVHSFIAIHDVMKYILRCEVSTLALGKTMSCGQMLLMSGAKGKRFVTPNTRVLVHEINAVAFGPLREMENDIAESKRLNDIFKELILKYTKINKKKLEELFSKDSHLTAKEAVDLGIADAIITNPKSLYSKIK